jgi:uncharacterized protein YecE (DUF72 family)
VLSTAVRFCSKYPLEAAAAGAVRQYCDNLPAMNERLVRIGTAGWNNPPEFRRPAPLSHLQHYAAHFNCVEVNSSFYRAHRRETYARWADQTGPDFQFSVKIPKVVTHERALRGCASLLDAFVAQVQGLGRKLAVLLLQLPPSLAWHASTVESFLTMMREAIAVPVVCGPRHESWSGVEVARQLARYGISLVRADPARLSGVRELVDAVRYYRLHGTPRVYWSSYSSEYLQTLSSEISTHFMALCTPWCIFDNTAAGAAWPNALALGRLLHGESGQARSPDGL